MVSAFIEHFLIAMLHTLHSKVEVINREKSVTHNHPLEFYGQKKVEYPRFAVFSDILTLAFHQGLRSLSRQNNKTILVLPCQLCPKRLHLSEFGKPSPLDFKHGKNPQKWINCWKLYSHTSTNNQTTPKAPVVNFQCGFSVSEIPQLNLSEMVQWRSRFITVR